MARKTIQGITIEIGGDTTKLQDALKGTENRLKDNQAALKDVNRLLKLDPGNVELLTQKQRLLTDSIKGTGEKLDVLKEAAKQAEAELANGNEKQRAQYEALQREIIETEQTLESLKGQMSDFGSVSAQRLANVGRQVQEVGGRISSVGTAMTQYVTGPIVAAGAAATAAWKDVDAGMDVIVKKTGASGEALRDMQERARNLATSIPTDFQTAGAAVGEVNTRFGLVGQALEDLSGKFIRFASLNDTDVSSSVDGVQSVMAAFHVDMKHAGDMLDVLNAAGQETGVSVSKLTSDLVANAAPLRKMGYGAATSAMFLARLEKNGVNATDVVTGMKTALKNATKEGKSMSTAVLELQQKIVGAKSDTKAMAVATELFGSKAGPALAVALREGRLSLEGMWESYGKFAGSVDKTFEETLDPLDQFNLSLNELKITGAELVTAAAPMIKTVAEGVRTAITGVRAAWEGLSPEAQQAVIKAAGIAAAVGPVLVVGGKVITGVGKLMEMGPKLISVFNGVKTAFSAVSAVMAANPIAVVIAAIAALVGAILYLWTHCKGFRDFWINLWKGAVDTAKNGAQWVINGLNAVGDWFVNLKNSALNWGRDLVQNFIDGIKNMWANAKRAVSDFAGMIKRHLGFSEPEEGPLANFHTYAPDMMRLFAQGIRDNERLVADQLSRSLDFKPRTPDAPGGAAAVPQGVVTTVERGADRPINVIFELNGAQRWIYRLNKAEEQRVGLKLT